MEFRPRTTNVSLNSPSSKRNECMLTLTRMGWCTLRATCWRGARISYQAWESSRRTCTIWRPSLWTQCIGRRWLDEWGIGPANSSKTYLSTSRRRSLVHQTCSHRPIRRSKSSYSALNTSLQKLTLGTYEVWTGSSSPKTVLISPQSE